MTIEEKVPNEQDTIGPLQLPEEILAKIFRFLDCRTLKNLKLVHSYFKSVVDSYCKLNLVLNFVILDKSVAPIANFPITTDEKFDRIIFRFVRFGCGYQKFLKNICCRTKKITIIADAYLIESSLKFTQIREILSACPDLEELELRLHVVNITDADDQQFLCETLQTLKKFKFKGEIKFQNSSVNSSSQIFKALSQGHISHLLWSRMGSKIFASSVTFFMNEEQKKVLVQAILNFLKMRKKELKTFWVDGFWDNIGDEAAKEILWHLGECEHLEQALIKCQDWNMAMMNTKKMSAMKYLRINLSYHVEQQDDELIASLIEDLVHLKVSSARDLKILYFSTFFNFGKS